MSARFACKVISLIVLLSLTLQPLAVMGRQEPALSRSKGNQETSRRGVGAPAPETGLYRTTVMVDSPARRGRLDALGVTVLAEGLGKAVVLADAEQLEALARLRFEPRGTDDVDALLDLTPLPPSLAGKGVDVLPSLLRGGAGGEVRAALAALSSIDDDADGLTNTEEAWWCTDPLNPDTDADGTNDGAEIQALKDWMGNKRAGPPGGTPWPSWPFNDTTCPDKDHDSIPNLAERWELGLNMDLESTDRDKFDDGQELFGVTYCPGGDLNCGYGDLPRSSDSGYVGAAMPSWVKAPGNHPLVAAFPVPEVDVVESSLHVQTVTEVTTDHVIGQGTEKSYSTSDTTGIEVSSSDTTTWNEWEENSITRPLTQAAAQSVARPAGKDPLGAYKLLDGRSSTYRKLARGAESVENLGTAFEAAKIVGTGIGYGLNWLVYEGALLANGQPLDLDFSRDDYDPNGALAEAEANRKEEERWQEFLGAVSGGSNLAENGALYAPNHDLSGVPNPHSPVVGSDGRTRIQTGYPMQYPVPRPAVSQTSTKGSSHGGAHTETTSKSESHTVTNGEAFSSSESWGNATAQDSAHAADLWFTYKVRNVGTDFARQLKHLVFNIYIGDEANPACSYHVGSTQCGVPVDTVLFSNLMPNEEHSYTSFWIPITLEQMKAIDLGGPIRISVEEFDYGADELFYQDARQGGLLVEIDDGSDDGEEEINGYLIPTFGDETILEVLAHYFPHDEDAGAGTVTAFWTPEKTATQPAWCQSGWQQGEMWWCKHALSTADWWNVTTSNAEATGEGFENTPAVPGATVLFRFNTDSDFDGYSDRSELRLGTEPDAPLSYPKPELLAGVHSNRTGNVVTATLSLLNTGLYDAYGVEAVMIAPDDTISITHNTVGGSGRVRATQQVVVGNRINLVSPSAAWQQAGHAWPAVGGYYTAQQDRTYTFQVSCGNAGGCDVGAGSWTIGWNDGIGASNNLDFGAGYASPALQDVGAYGVKVGLVSGRVYNGDTFTVNARISRATFNYVINREPYTAPIVLVSYNDPQGNHRFGIPPAAMALSSPTANLSGFSGQMHQEPGMNIVSTAPAGSGPQTAQLVVNNPTGVTLQDAHLFLDIVTVTDTVKIAGGTVPAGKILAEIVATTNLPAGPSIQPMTFDLANYTTATAQEYIILVLATDYQGNVLATAARPLSSFQEDPKPAFAMTAADATWDFGTAAQGTLLKRSFTFANTGALDLLTYVSAPAELTVSQTGSRRVGLADMTTYEMALNTANLPVGPYAGDITIRTSDPANSTRTVHVVGTVTAAPADTPVGAAQRPLDWPATVSGTQGQWVEFTHTLGPEPQTLQPVKVYSQDYASLKGVGKYATPFGAGTASYDMFGDGRDGTLVVASGQTAYPGNERTALFGLATTGQSSLPVASTASFNTGDKILLIQSQGTGVGSYEFGTVQSKDANNLTLKNTIRNSYISASYRNSACGNTGAGLLGQYYSNKDLAGTPVFTRCDNTIRFNWEGGGPGGGLSNDQFSIRWSGELAFPVAGSYSFHVGADDGVRVYLDGVLIVDEWHDSDSSYTVTRSVTAGSHSLVIEYYENGGNARVNFQPPQENLRAQVVRVPQYQRIEVQSGGRLAAPGWDGVTGGIIAFAANDVASISGAVQINGGNGATGTDGNPSGGSGGGYRGGNADGRNNDNYGSGFQGEGTEGFGTYTSTPNGNGGGAGPGSPSVGNYGTGGGGGNGSAGAPSTSGGIGAGGLPAGNSELTSMVFGGGGGGSNDNPGNSIGGGGGGGGIIVVMARNLSIYGNMTTNGGQAGGGKWGGGGGAGGSILMSSQSVSIGANHITALGGTAVRSGGSGGIGRIRIEYCDSFDFGTTSPTASAAKIACHVAEQIESSPYDRARLNLPESGTHTYQVQYGRKLNWGGAAHQVTSLRVPAGLFTSVTLQALVSDLPSNATFGLEVGEPYAACWSPTVVSNNSENTSANLAACFNAYWASHGAPTTGYLDVPVRVYLDRAGQVLLTNLQVTPAGNKTRAIRLPVQPQGYSSVAASFTVSGGAGPLAVGVDVGGDGTVDWTYTGAPAYPASLTTGNLAAAVNAYLAAHPGAEDVPLRFYLSPFATLNLTGFTATPVGGTDASIGAGDVTFGGVSSAVILSGSAQSAALPTQTSEESRQANARLFAGVSPSRTVRVEPAQSDSASASDPTEGDTITVNATIHNGGTLDTGPLTAAFYAIRTTQYADYIGSALVPSIAPSFQLPASISWNTLGFTGTVPVRVVVDPYNRVAELSETNNVATATVAIRTRPDLSIPAIALSDDEPVAGETVTVTLPVRNTGQATAGGQTVALYDGNPDAGGTLVGDHGGSPLPGGMTTTVTFVWTPATPGAYRLFARADRDRQVAEYDEGNNDRWLDVYVGFRGPIIVDSGTIAADPVYMPTLGYGYVDEGQPDVTGNCGTASWQTYRRDPGGRVVYRFDHLLPHHFYHLDVTLYECDRVGRQETIKVDGNAVAGPIDLGDAISHTLSLRLDPALYADHTISVTVEAPGMNGAVAGALALHDVDYRYADAGGSADCAGLSCDPAWPGGRGYGYLEGVAPSPQPWGSLPYQSVRVNQDGNELRYRFDDLDPAKRYQLHLTFHHVSGATIVQKLQMDGADAGPSYNLASGVVYSPTLAAPAAGYADDRSIVVGVVRLGAGAGAFVNEISLEEQTAESVAGGCFATLTPYASDAYGPVTINGAAAPVGTIVQAINPRGDTVGCFTVQSSGAYVLRIYGEDATASPPIPGMRDGELVEFRVNGTPTVAMPSLYWHDDKGSHPVELIAGPVEGQSIILAAPKAPFWSLLSFYLEPPVPLVPRVLSSIESRYDRVLSEKGVYAPGLPVTYTTLSELHASLGYWVRITDTTSANLLAQGLTVPPTTTLALHAGWNWVGYLPETVLPITTALASIEGSYLRVWGDRGAYQPDLEPQYITLWDLRPGEGYLMRVSQAVSLTYPAGGTQVAATEPTVRPQSACPAIGRTPYLSLAYGPVMVGGQPAAIGAIVEAITPRGEVAGCTTVMAAGYFGVMALYGEDATASPAIPGFHRGEPVAFRVNGRPVIASPALAWQDDLEAHFVKLRGEKQGVYLPWVGR